MNPIFKNLRLFDLYYRKNNLRILHYQKGGSLSFKYKNEKIKFERYLDEKNNLEIYLQTFDNKDKCISITIEKNTKTAYLAEINSKFGECLKNTDFASGKHYLSIAINLLKKYQDKLNINQIILNDTSTLYYNGCAIDLVKLSILQSGDTFYGKQGFRPQNPYRKIDYEKNKDILNSIYTKDINLDKFLKNYNNQILTNEITKLSQKYKNENVKKNFF